MRESFPSNLSKQFSRCTLSGDSHVWAETGSKDSSALYYWQYMILLWPWSFSWVTLLRKVLRMHTFILQPDWQAPRKCCCFVAQNTGMFSHPKCIYYIVNIAKGFTGGSVVKNSPSIAGDNGFDPWVGKILWRRKWQSAPVFFPGESHGQRSLAYSPLGHSESEIAQSCLTLYDPVGVAYQTPPSRGFSRPKYWSGFPFPSLGDLPNPGIQPRPPALQADALPSEPPGKHGVTE